VSGLFSFPRPALSVGAFPRIRVFAYVVRGVVSGHPFDEVTGASIGRVGFFWGGSLAGVIENLKITGRIDYERTLAGLKRRK